MDQPEAIVSKGRFAAICNVSPGRVTQWIAEGKISGAALQGEGRAAKIVVAIAQRQLRARIDSGQAFGNGLATRLRAPAASPPTLPPRRELGGDTLPRAVDPDDALDEQIKREKLDALQRTNRKAAADEAAAQGRYTGTAAARRQLALVASQTLRIFEGALPEIASALAATFKLEDRDVLLVLNAQLRKVREQAARAARRTAEDMPALVADDQASPEA